MMKAYDHVIVGAGSAGCALAHRLSAVPDMRVLLLEATGAAGGLGANREFHPGFHASIAHSVSHFAQKIVNDLKLASYGFETTANTLPTVGLSAGKEHVVIHQDSIRGTSADDSDAYQDYSRLMQRFAGVLKPFWLKTMPRIGCNSLAEMLTFAHLGLNIRRIGRNDMREFLRVISLPARDLMDEYFDSDILKATLSWDGLIGSKLAPRSPNAAVLAMLYRMAGESKGAHNIPSGGVTV